MTRNRWSGHQVWDQCSDALPGLCDMIMPQRTANGTLGGQKSRTHNLWPRQQDLIRTALYIGVGTVRRGVAQLVARVVWDDEVAGSSPVTPTLLTNLLCFVLACSNGVRPCTQSRSAPAGRLGRRHHRPGAPPAFGAGPRWLWTFRSSHSGVQDRGAV